MLQLEQEFNDEDITKLVQGIKKNLIDFHGEKEILLRFAQQLAKKSEPENVAEV